MATSTEPRHPIRVVAQRTGLTVATLRAWERRHDVVSPVRSEGGQRLYSDEDILRLTRLRLLTEAGRSISSVAGLDDSQAEALLEEDRASVTPGARAGRAAEDAAAPWLTDAVRLVGELDGEGLERCLRRAAVTLGAQAFLETVVTPLLHHVGTAWTMGQIQPGHEHLCTVTVERILNWMSEPAAPKPGVPRIVVATLRGERHGLGAMLVAASAGLEGWRVTHLGTDLPTDDIVQAAHLIGANAVAISVIHVTDPAETAREVHDLRRALPPDTALIVGGAGATRLQNDLASGVHVVSGLGPLQELLASLA